MLETGEPWRRRKKEAHRIHLLPPARRSSRDTRGPLRGQWSGAHRPRCQAAIATQAFTSSSSIVRHGCHGAGGARAAARGDVPVAGARPHHPVPGAGQAPHLPPEQRRRRHRAPRLHARQPLGDRAAPDAADPLRGARAPPTGPAARAAHHQAPPRGAHAGAQARVRPRGAAPRRAAGRAPPGPPPLRLPLPVGAARGRRARRARGAPQHLQRRRHRLLRPLPRRSPRLPVPGRRARQRRGGGQVHVPVRRPGAPRRPRPRTRPPAAQPRPLLGLRRRQDLRRHRAPLHGLPLRAPRRQGDRPHRPAARGRLRRRWRWRHVGRPRHAVAGRPGAGLRGARLLRQRVLHVGAAAGADGARAGAQRRALRVGGALPQGRRRRRRAAPPPAPRPGARAGGGRVGAAAARAGAPGLRRVPVALRVELRAGVAGGGRAHRRAAAAHRPAARRQAGRRAGRRRARAAGALRGVPGRGRGARRARGHARGGQPRAQAPRPGAAPGGGAKRRGWRAGRRPRPAHGAPLPQGSPAIGSGSTQQLSLRWNVCLPLSSFSIDAQWQAMALSFRLSNRELSE